MVSQALKEPVAIIGPDYLIEAVQSAGMAAPGAMGLVPLSWQDILAWKQATGSALSPWELEIMRYLSQSFASEAHRAKDPTAPPPHLTTIRPRAVADLKAAMRSAARG
jgi:hypothetical protein